MDNQNQNDNLGQNQSPEPTNLPGSVISTQTPSDSAVPSPETKTEPQIPSQPPTLPPANNLTQAQSLPPNPEFNAQKSGPRKKLIAGLIVLVVILIAAILYFWFLPSRMNSSYLNNINPAYDQQNSQMKQVYDSLNRKIFTTNDSTAASDKADLAYVDSVIKKAKDSTDQLKSQNHLTILPGTKLFGPAKNTDKKYETMQGYINDSQKFLDDFQDVSTYWKQLNNIEDTQLPEVLNTFNQLANVTTIGQLMSISQSASEKLDKLTTSLNAITPPPDFKQIHESLIADMSSISDDFQEIVSGIKDQNIQQISDAGVKLQKDGNALQELSKTDIAGMFQNSSVIHKEMVKLKSQNPLH